MFKNITLRITNKLKSKSIDFDSSSVSTILISGMGRSGTTWLSELINYNNEYRDIFEPFFPIKVKEAAKFKYLQYLNPNDSNIDLVSDANRILSGNFISAWTDTNNNKIISLRRIIKDIRTNLKLKWLKQLRPEMPILLLVRNPFSVIDSYRELGWGIEAGGSLSNFENIVQQKQLIDDHPIIRDILSIINKDDYISQLIFVWCVLYHIPIKQLNNEDYKLVYYEDLVLSPVETLHDIFTYLERKVDMKKLQKVINNPSNTNYRNMVFKKNDTDRITNWKTKFTQREKNKINDMIKRFKLDYLYDIDGYPSTI